MSKQEIYVYSLDGQEFRDRDGIGWEAREEALLVGRENAATIARLKEVDPGPVWTGVKVGYEAAAFFPHADALVDFLSESAEGEVGEDALDGWPQIQGSAEAEKELVDFVESVMHPFLEQWAEKHHLKPTFWSVTDVAKHADDDGAIAKAEN